MDLLHELYDAYDHSDETESARLDANKNLLEYIESNVSDNEKAIFLDTIESTIKCREQYFFQAGFKAAKALILK